MNRRNPLYFFLLSILSIFFAACSSDSEVALPDYFMGYATVLRQSPTSDSFSIRLDDWKEYPLDYSAVNMDLNGSDSVRVICYYTYENGQTSSEGSDFIIPTLKLISVAPVQIPSNVAEVPNHGDDPISFVSMSKGAYFLNFLFEVSVKEKAHSFYVEDPFVIYDALGKVHLLYHLYHDCNGDYAAYSSRVYMSIPLYSYWNTLQDGGSVTIQYRDEDDLVQYYTLNY